MRSDGISFASSVLEDLDKEKNGLTGKAGCFVIESNGLGRVGTGGEIQVKHNKIVDFCRNLCIIIDLFKHFMKK